MKQVNILNGIFFAVVASLAGAVLLNLLPLIFPLTTSISLTIAVLALGYLMYLCRYSQIRQGRVILFIVWVIINFSAWLFDLNLLTQLGLNLCAIWLVRFLYFHSTLVAALLDLLLISMAGGAASWALFQTASLVAAIWIFFLCQSLFSAIPQLTKSNANTEPDINHTSRFQAAHHVAQDAVRKLSLN